MERLLPSFFRDPIIAHLWKTSQVTETLPDKDITEPCFQLMSPNLNYKYGLGFRRVAAGCFSGN